MPRRLHTDRWTTVHGSRPGERRTSPVLRNERTPAGNERTPAGNERTLACGAGAGAGERGEWGWGAGDAEEPPGEPGGSSLYGGCYFRIFVTVPAPTVRPPSRMAKPRPSSIAIGWIRSTVISVVSPGMTISVPSGSVMTPVTSVVRK